MKFSRVRVVLLLVAVVGFSLVFAGVGTSGVRTTNVANLDDGTCGRNLQVGSDTTASATSTPTFLLWGDGGLSKYDIFVDGVKIGTFSSDGFANVCIPTTVPISDGPHVLTSREWAEASEAGRWATEVRPFTRNRRHALYRLR